MARFAALLLALLPAVAGVVLLFAAGSVRAGQVVQVLPGIGPAVMLVSTGGVMKREIFFLVLCLVPALLAGLINNPWVDLAALAWPCVMVGGVVLALVVRGLVDGFR